MTILRLLKDKNSFLFFTSQIFSLSGNYIQQIVVSWEVYKTTSSPFLLGAVDFAANFPILIFSLYSSILARKYKKSTIIVYSQALLIIVPCILFFSALKETLQIWHILILMCFFGIINSVIMSTRQSLIFHLLENKEDAGSAYALNTLIFYFARFIAPAIAGIIVLYNVSYCFLIEAVFFAGAVLIILKINLKQQVTPSILNQHNYVKTLAKAFSYISSFALVRNTFLFMSVIHLLAVPLTVLMPAFLALTFNNNEDIFMNIMAIYGVGGIAGACYLIAHRKVKNISKFIIIPSYFFSLFLLLLTFSNNIYLLKVLMFFMGFCLVQHISFSKALLQTIVHDNERDVISSFITIVFVGIPALGSLCLGIVSTLIGVNATFRLSAVLCLLATFLFACANKHSATQQKKI